MIALTSFSHIPLNWIKGTRHLVDPLSRPSLQHGEASCYCSSKSQYQDSLSRRKLCTILNLLHLICPQICDNFRFPTKKELHSKVSELFDVAICFPPLYIWAFMVVLLLRRSLRRLYLSVYDTVRPRTHWLWCRSLVATQKSSLPFGSVDDCVRMSWLARLGLGWKS